jgi:hypothetical protein
MGRATGEKRFVVRQGQRFTVLRSAARPLKPSIQWYLSAEVQGPEHDDALSFTEEAKYVQIMYGCLLPHAYAYQWCL